MSLAQDVKSRLETERRRNGGFRDQLERYREFKADMAEHGVVLSEDSYNIPLMTRLRRDPSRARAKCES